MKPPELHVEDLFSGPSRPPSAGPPRDAWNPADMDEMELLEKARQLAARDRQVRALGAAGGALCPGAALALFLVLLLSLSGQPAWQGLAPLALLPAGAALKEFLQPLRLVRAAYQADRNLGLQERLGTAVEWLLSERPRSLMAQVLLQDAASQARLVRPRAAFPQRWPGGLRTGLLLAVLAITLAGLPPGRLSWQRPDAEALTAARRQAQELRHLLHDRSLHLQSARLLEFQARLEALERSLESPGVDAREVLERMTALSEELQGSPELASDPGAAQDAAADRQGQIRSARQLREAARALAEDPASEGARSLLERLADAPESSEEVGGVAARALESLRKGDPEGAARALAQGQGEGPGEGREASAGEGPTPPGEGRQALANPGQQVQPGQGTGEADFGRGTTLEHQESAETRSRDFVLERQSQRTADWTEEYRRLHPPRRDHLPSADARVPGRLGEGPTLRDSGQALGRPRVGDPARVQPQEGFHQARESAEAAVAREEIPSTRRDLVRDYFEGIDPRL